MQQPALSKLPVPMAEELAHSQTLSAFLKDLMIGKGSLSFEEWMQQCLYKPGLGYYSNTREKLANNTDTDHSIRGDFITAPELSPWFARTLSIQVLDILNACGHYTILEFGAGSGALAYGLLSTLNAQSGNHQSSPDKDTRLTSPKINYLILEVSADLRSRQKERLKDFEGQVTWLDQLPADNSFSGCIIANEVLDAIPVRLIGYDSQLNLIERSVKLNPVIDEADTQTSPFIFDDQLLPIEQAPEGIERLPKVANYLSEFNQLARAWISQLGTSLKSGGVLLIDYGFPANEYYHPQRNRGTLMCHFKHRAHSNPLLYPGIQDITAHVDFSAIAESAVQAGLEVLGYTSQANFLLNCGLLELLQTIDPQDLPRFTQAMGPVQKLLGEAEMGELFKVMLLGKHLDIDPIGFTRSDRRYQL